MSKQKEYAKQLLARAMYHKWCEFKNFPPKRFPYVSDGSIDYADTAIEMLGYDDESITIMEEFLAERGDPV